VAARIGILFDVDGTLVDNVYLHVTAWWQAFRASDHDVLMADIHRSIGMDSDRLIRRLIDGDDDDDTVASAHSALYAAAMPGLRAITGARDVLTRLRDDGYVVVLASSAPEGELKGALAALGGDDLADVFTNADDVDKAKPEPDLLEVAMERAHLSRDSCLMVGDTTWDVAAAQRAGIACIGVRTGGIAASELEAAGAVDVVDDVTEIRPTISRLLERPRS
jgi:HAD superfamily hydrolase (TIGR01509 family)